jgi:hypothetical protein
MASVHTVIVTGEGDLAPLQGCGKTVLRYEEVLAAEEESFDWPELDEAVRRGHVLYERYHRRSQRRRLQPPFDVPSLPDRLHS